MKASNYWLILIVLLSSNMGIAQTGRKPVDLFGNPDMTVHHVNTAKETYKGKKALKVKDTGVDTVVKLVKFNQPDFKNGIIEVSVSGKPAEGSAEQARGFVGIAFRINDDNSKFECIYLRPANGRAEDQVRRNHSVQYVSHPGYPWQKLRSEFPEKYESYADLVPGEWVKMKIEIKGDKARLFVHGNSQPSLIVNDLKLGPDHQGSIGLWIGPGTEAHFSKLFVTRLD